MIARIFTSYEAVEMAPEEAPASLEIATRVLYLWKIRI